MRQTCLDRIFAESGFLFYVGHRNEGRMSAGMRLRAQLLFSFAADEVANFLECPCSARGQLEGLSFNL